MTQSIPNLNEARLKIVHPQIADLPYAAQEAVNILRGNIQLSGNHLQVIAITSASKEEGKSSVAIQLAKSFAALNRTTVYVDCDIRKSKTLRRYQINEQVVGLTEYLCGSCRIDDIVYRTDNQNMDMIFTGAAAPNPSELLSDPIHLEEDKFVEVICSCKEFSNLLDYVYEHQLEAGKYSKQKIKESYESFIREMYRIMKEDEVNNEHEKNDHSLP